MSDTQADETYDYVVVGAGSSGSVVAARLSENPSHRVLLLEVGQAPDTYWHRLPLGPARLVHDVRTSWPFLSGPEQDLKQRRVTAVRGKALGGSSAINGMLWTRGDASAYDRWASLGNPGWGFEDVLPFFRKIESFPHSDPRFRGSDGPVHIATTRPEKLSEAFIASCLAHGLKANPDYNAGSSEGVAYLQTNTFKGQRWGTYEAYLQPALLRPNLRVVKGAATTLMLERQRVTGVRYRHLDGDGLGPETCALARAQVILSAGAYQTPALLERSGIGQPDALAKLGIAVRHALPGVGENLSDHMRACVSYASRVPTINDIVHNPLAKIKAGLAYTLFRKGWLATASMTVQAITRASTDSQRADLKLQINGISTDTTVNSENRPVRKQSGFSLLFFPIYPHSRGSVHARSTDPLAEPVIDTGYLRDPRDQVATLSGLHLARAIARKGPLADLIIEETDPGADCTNESELLDYIRATGLTVYHPVGTCRMGTDELAVVDPQLRVRGLQGLRIADASVMPELVATNTNAPSIMIGERAASWILADART
jgi:choline dehydrogenase